jgi:putative membrane protein
VSVFLAVLVHVAGAIGMSFFNRDLFVAFTPVNLLLMLLLLLWNEARIYRNLIKAFVAASLTGLISEMIGVHTGLLFGHYVYGSVLGGKIWGVPVLIGLNWFCIVYCSYVVALRVFKRIVNPGIYTAILAGLLATMFDWVMEPVAIKLGFWQWEGGLIPVYNFFCWWAIATGVSYGFFLLRIKQDNVFAPILFFVQFIFFLMLRILL